MKHIFKILGMISAFVLLLAGLSVPVRADVIYEPDNSFYNHHEEECRLENDQFVVNGPRGYIHVYRSPQENFTMTLLENNTVIYLSAVWTDEADVSWGLYEDFKDSSNTGWVPMPYMYRYYDGAMFLDDVEGETTVSTEKDLPGEDESVVVYLYPGSNVCHESKGLPWHYGEHFWIDEEGRTWIGMTMQNNCDWVCLDAPGALFAELYPDGPVIRDQRVIENRDENGNEIIPTPEAGGKIFFMISIAVVACGLAATFLIFMLAMKKRKEQALLK